MNNSFEYIDLAAWVRKASVELPYDISCKIQRSELKPAEKNVSFPTLARNARLSN